MLVFFKREFSFDSTKRVWEALLSDYYTPHYELFFACAMIDQSRDEIIKKKMYLDDIMLLMNELAGTRRTTPLLLKAEELYRRFMERLDVDVEIHRYVSNEITTISDAVVEEEPPPRAPAHAASPSKSGPPVYDAPKH